MKSNRISRPKANQFSRREPLLGGRIHLSAAGVVVVVAYDALEEGARVEGLQAFIVGGNLQQVQDAAVDVLQQLGIAAAHPFLEGPVDDGHTPVPEAEWLNNTIDIDTGCVFGGKLTALRYPERELVNVPAEKQYAEPKKPLVENTDTGLTAQQLDDETIDISEFIGKQFIETGLDKRITIKVGNNAAALEVMSRFAVNPKWLIYLPPTMSPVETSDRDAFLEYPTQAFDYYRKQGVEEVVCEVKHMGSRAIAVVCQNESAAQSRFGLTDAGIGTIYTRTGRPFFADKALESAFLDRLQTALTKSGFWQKHETNWVCLDCELMPWSAKA